MPSIEQYQMFVAVAESKSLREAAERVFKTQPTVTSAIKKMESSLGVKLFDRGQYRLQLTNTGTSIYKLALKLLANQEEIIQLATQFKSGQEPVITIAIAASFDFSIILKALEYAQKHYRSTQIIFQQEYMTGALEQLMLEQADFAISPINLSQFPVGEVDIKFVSSGQFVNVASPKLLQRHLGVNSVKQLIDEYQIVVKDSGSNTSGKNVGVQQGQRVWTVNNFEAKRLLIEEGMGWGTMPMNLVEKHIKDNKLVALELSDYPTIKNIDYQLLKLSKKNLGPVATKLCQLL